MEPTWVLSAPDGPHVVPMNLAIWFDAWIGSGPSSVVRRGSQEFQDSVWSQNGMPISKEIEHYVFFPHQ